MKKEQKTLKTKDELEFAKKQELKSFNEELYTDMSIEELEARLEMKGIWCEPNCTCNQITIEF